MVMPERDMQGVFNTWKPPQVVVRVIDDDRIRGNSANSVNGKIRNDLIAKSIQIAPLPSGSSLTLLAPFQWFIKAGQVEEMLEDLRGKTIAVEMRTNLSNRAVQKILFRGKLASRNPIFNEGSNGFTFTVNDSESFCDAPIKFNASSMRFNEILQTMDQGFEYVPSVTSAGRTTRVRKFFPQYPFPVDRNGNRLAGIDPSLFIYNVRPDGVSMTGAKLAQAFSSVVQKYNLIPTLRHENKFTWLTAITRGRVIRELVVGAIGQFNPDVRIMPNTAEISGSEDYSSITNTAIGELSEEEILDVSLLEKSWTSTEETAVLANPALQSTPRYSHVGTEYKLPRKLFGIIGKPHGQTGNLKDSMRFFLKKTPDGSALFTGDVWKQSDLEWEFVRRRSDGSTQGLTIDDLSKLNPAQGRLLSIRFKSNMGWEDFTAAQNAQRQAGTAVDPTKGFYQVKVEAVQIGERPTVSTGLVGSFPRQRSVLVDKSDSHKTSVRKRFDVSDSGIPTDVTSDSSLTRDDRSSVYNQLYNYIITESEPSANLNIRLIFFEPSWNLGDRIIRIKTVEREVLYDDKFWFVEGITHDFERWSTDLTLNSNYMALLRN